MTVAAAGEGADASAIASVSPVRTRHPRGVDPEPLGRDLREQRVVALAGRRRADGDDEPVPSRRTVACSNSPPERSTHSATPTPTSARAAPPAAAPTPRAARGGPARRGQRARRCARVRAPASPRPEQVQRGVEAALEVAGVVGPAQRGPVRERAHEVAAAQLERVDPQLPRGGVDRRLDQVRRLGPARRRGRARSAPCSSARR